MNEDPENSEPVSKKIPQSPAGTSSFSRGFAVLLLLGVGLLAGFAAVEGEEKGGFNPIPHPGTGIFAAGCVIAAALIISRKSD